MDELDDDLERLFDEAEQNAVLHDWRWRSYALRLFDSSTCIDETHLEDDIATGQWTPEEKNNLFTRLLMNQLEYRSHKRFGVMDWIDWMKKTFNY